MNNMKEVVNEAVDLFMFFLENRMVVNPDLGVLKSDGTSAFKALSDENAQKMQECIDICVTILKEDYEIDAYEIAMWLTVHMGIGRHVQLRLDGDGGEESRYFNREYIERIRSNMFDNFGVNVIKDYANESAQTRSERRASYMIKLISEVQNLHPIFDDSEQTSASSGGFTAIALVTDLTPLGWSDIVTKAVTKDLGGAYTGQIESAPEDMKDEVVSCLDDYLLKTGDYDDDPTKEWD
jgi:hypothetical protein